MPDQDSGQDKVKKICDALKAETLDPARAEAQRIVRDAKKQAEDVIAKAREEEKRILESARAQIENEKASGESALKLAARQTVEALKQTIEKELFNPELKALLETKLSSSEVVAKLIDTVVGAIEKEGIEADLEAAVPRGVSADEVNKALAKGVVERLKGQGVVIGEIGGGAEIKMVDEHITLDISDEALTNLLSCYIREDFRELIFNR